MTAFGNFDFKSRRTFVENAYDDKEVEGVEWTLVWDAPRDGTFVAMMFLSSHLDRHSLVKMIAPEEADKKKKGELLIGYQQTRLQMAELFVDLMRNFFTWLMKREIGFLNRIPEDAEIVRLADGMNEAARSVLDMMRKGGWYQPTFKLLKDATMDGVKRELEKSKSAAIESVRITGFTPLKGRPGSIFNQPLDMDALYTCSVQLVREVR